MAEFSRVMITSKGHTLIAKLIAGTGSIEFTKICSSSAKYTLGDLESLTELSDIKQTNLVSKVICINDVSVQVEAAFTNTDLTEGYFMRTLGLYAVDPDVGEILYAVTIEVSGNCYMPPYNGIAVSGAYIQIVTTVGNAENVTFEVNEAAVATIGDVKDLQVQIDNIVDALCILINNENIKASFLSVFPKVGTVSDGTAMTAEEVETAMATQWNGESSDDGTAMTAEEVETAMATQWNGESSDDPTALSADEVEEATM